MPFRSGNRRSSSSGSKKNSTHSTVPANMNVVPEEISADFSVDLAFEFADDEDDESGDAAGNPMMSIGDGDDDDDDSISLGALGGLGLDTASSGSLSDHNNNNGNSDDDLDMDKRNRRGSNHSRNSRAAAARKNGLSKQTNQENDNNQSSSTRTLSATDLIQQRTQWAKYITWTLLVLVALAIPVLVFVSTRHDNCLERQQEFEWMGESLQNSVHSELARQLHALESLARLAALATNTNIEQQVFDENTIASTTSYPTVEQDFQTQVENLLGVAATATDDEMAAAVMEAVFLAPLVKDPAAWEAFVATTTTTMPPQIHGNLNGGTSSSTIWLPVWQMSPWDATLANFNLASVPSLQRAVEQLQASAAPTESSYLVGELEASEWDFESKNRMAFILQPIYNAKTDKNVVGYVVGLFRWSALWAKSATILPHDDDEDDTVPAVAVHIQNNNMDTSTFLVIETAQVTEQFEGGKQRRINTGKCYEEVCFDLTLSQSFQACLTPAQVTSPRATVLDVILAAVIAVLLLVVFYCYDLTLSNAQDQLAQAANQSLAVVSSLFPKGVTDRLLEKDGPMDSTAHGGESISALEHSNNKLTSRRGLGGGRNKSNKSNLTNYLSEHSEHGEKNGLEYLTKTKPIADLFPETTIMFADLVGFTAWSSAREPTQVFRLLETIYFHFDDLAKQRKVFKVETVGDCYVAVCGLPEPRKDHALVMCKFARDCLVTFNRLVKQLEVELGPDTGDLGLRVGLHSGQTTAGVLRGDRARFQLFGDTVNVTSRMESTGKPGMIQLSKQTADKIMEHNKGHWIRPRDEKVTAKGKGDLSTFWLQTYSNSQESSGIHSETEWTEAVEGLEMLPQEVGGELQRTISQQMMEDATATHITEAEKRQRLVEWNADLLIRLLQAIIARRQARGSKADNWNDIEQIEDSFREREALVMEEVVEVIEMPNFSQARRPPGSVELSPDVIQQVKVYVENLSYMYRDNPFHNFEHASHVSQSVNKLLSRIVAPDLQLNGSADFEHTLHDHTYGITSDPLTQFACVLSALIHDVDHTGLPNSQLVKEETPLAKAYNYRSVAEQNSIDLAWDALMQPQYTELRKAIYQSKEELNRFRQLVVNSVLATDIMDKELKKLRNQRWDKAFAEKSQDHGSRELVENRKATIVIEHIIQASDVSHTMQHWQIYRKWNERLFEELYNAYREGRAENDPTEGWYKGELGFLDFYIIPLAKKLKECGVFGVSSDEYLNYALSNRAEWEDKGQTIVAEMRERMDGAKSRQGKSLKKMSLMNVPKNDFSAHGGSSFSSLNVGNLFSQSCSQIPSNLLPSGGSRRNLLAGRGNLSPNRSRRTLLMSTNSARSLGLGSLHSQPSAPNLYKNKDGAPMSVEIASRRNSTGGVAVPEPGSPKKGNKKGLLREQNRRNSTGTRPEAYSSSPKRGILKKGSGSSRVLMDSLDQEFSSPIKSPRRRSLLKNMGFGGGPFNESKPRRQQNAQAPRRQTDDYEKEDPASLTASHLSMLKAAAPIPSLGQEDIVPEQMPTSPVKLTTRRPLMAKAPSSSRSFACSSEE